MEVYKIVRDEDNGHSSFEHLTNAGITPASKLGIPDGQHFVHQENISFEMCCDGKPEPHVHPRAVELQGRVDRVADPENSTMLSNCLEISLRDMPRIAPLMSDVSRDP